MEMHDLNLGGGRFMAKQQQFPKNISSNAILFFYKLAKQLRLLNAFLAFERTIRTKPEVVFLLFHLFVSAQFE